MSDAQAEQQQGTPIPMANVIDALKTHRDSLLYENDLLRIRVALVEAELAELRKQITDA